MTEVPESAAAVARRMRAWQGGHLSGVESTHILAAVRDAVNEASSALRKIRDWCDRTEQAVGARAAAGALAPEDLGLSRAVLIVRTLLPPVPEVAEEVGMDDREYPGDGDNTGTDSGN